MLHHLVASFATLPDPRCAGRTRHRFLDLLVIAVCAVVAGAETWVDIAPYGQMKHAWLRTFLDLPHGIASHDTFRRVFSLVDPQGLEHCFRQWMARRRRRPCARTRRGGRRACRAPPASG